MTRISPHLVEKICHHLSGVSRITLLTHVNPDGDAIGSLLGLYWYLHKRGFNVSIVIPNEFPFFLDWLPASEKILVYEQEPEKSIEEITHADILFCLDFNEPDRLGKLCQAFTQMSVPKILVDHHPEPHDFTDFVISDAEAGSTAELIYDLICRISGKNWVDKNIAECLFTGIMTDTGCFSYNSSLPGTYLVVADLLATGINKDEIYTKVYDNYSSDRMRLLGYSLNEKMVIIPEYHTAYISLSQEELKRFNHVVGDTEGFVNYPFSIKGIRLTALFVEKEGYVKISFRSKGDFEINKFSEKYFNGGGHKNAAGGESNLSLEETLKRFEELLPLYANELK